MWKLVDKFARKITKSNGNARQINVPRSVQNIISETDVQLVILKDENENFLIAICAIDAFQSLMNAINKGD
jgi:hypothetical protein